MAPINHLKDDGASTPQSEGPRDAKRRTKDGCLVCRLRKTKCPGRSPEDPTSCADCISLSIICLGFPGARPRWMKSKEKVREMRRRIKEWTDNRGVRDGFLNLSGYSDEISNPHGAVMNRSSAASGDVGFASAPSITLPPGPHSAHSPPLRATGTTGAAPGANGIISVDHRPGRPVRWETMPSILTLDRSHTTLFSYPNLSSPPPNQDHAHGRPHPLSTPAADTRTQSYVFPADGPNIFLGQSVPQSSNLDWEFGGLHAPERYIPPSSSLASIPMSGMYHSPFSLPPVFSPQPHLGSPVSFPPVSGALHSSSHHPGYWGPESNPSVPPPSASSLTQGFPNALSTAFMTDLVNEFGDQFIDRPLHQPPWPPE